MMAKKKKTGKNGADCGLTLVMTLKSVQIICIGRVDDDLAAGITQPDQIIVKQLFSEAFIISVCFF